MDKKLHNFTIGQEFFIDASNADEWVEVLGQELVNQIKKPHSIGAKEVFVTNVDIENGIITVGYKK